MALIDQVMQYLQSQGLQPTAQNWGVDFKYQMRNFTVLKDDNDDQFFQLCMPGIFDVTEDNLAASLIACNTINNTKKVVKAVNNEGKIWLCYEVLVDSTPEWGEFIPRALGMLLGAQEAFYKEVEK